MARSLALLAIAATVAAEAGGGGDSTPSRWTNVRRRLSYEKIAGYQPMSQVTDHCAVDRDQAAMESQLALETLESFARAHRIYNEGGNSESYARIALLWPGGLVRDLREGGMIMGATESGDRIMGTAYEVHERGDRVIKVRYETSLARADYVGCQVGALVKTNTKYCFAGEGELNIDGTLYPYHYNPTSDNRNGRTIADFSKGINARDMMHSEDFSYFSNYYGTPDYVHQFIEAAFMGKSTQFTKENQGSFPFANGNADFHRYGFVGREQFIARATVCMSIFMFVVRQWEEALDDCERGCVDCNKGNAHSWDEGVCFYTGSIEGEDGLSDDGELLHQLADDACGHHRTCGVWGKNQTGTAKVNYDLFSLFTLGNFQIASGNCPAARATAREIVGKMYVPLIQGAVRSAHGVDRQGDGERERAEGAAFAAAVLPRVHASSPEAARVIYENLKVGAPSTDAGAVKKAFESVYAHIGISCEDVGGLWNEGEGEYYAGMEPCHNEPNEDQHSLAIVLGSTFGALFGPAAATAIYIMHKISAKKAEDAAAKAADEHGEVTKTADSPASSPVPNGPASPPVDGLISEAVALGPAPRAARGVASAGGAPADGAPRTPNPMQLELGALRMALGLEPRPIEVEALSEPLVPIFGAMKFAVLLHNVLTPAECSELIERAEGEGLKIGERNCSESVVEDGDLAGKWYQRVVGALESEGTSYHKKLMNASWTAKATMGEDEEVAVKKSVPYKAVGMNGRLRLRRYKKGEFSSPHVDASVVRGAGGGAGETTSLASVHVYLNHKFKGGLTTFRGGERHLDVTPRTGSVLVFEHGLQNEGRMVTQGKKYVVRSEVMYAVTSDASGAGPDDAVEIGLCTGVVRG